MDVNPISNIMNENSTSSSLSNIAQNSMGKQEFLELLVAQLKNQDPLSPLEGQEFASQLAQFSNVELLTSIDSNMVDGINADMALAQAMSNTMAATFIGREVTALGNGIMLSDEAPATIQYSLSSEAQDVTITIRDETGRVVRTIEKSGYQKGRQTVEWDGENDNGESLPPGKYSYEVEATSADGSSVSATTYTVGAVTGVRYANGSAYLVLGDIEIAFADVLQIGM